jgi:hypothetical protein
VQVPVSEQGQAPGAGLPLGQGQAKVLASEQVQEPVLEQVLASGQAGTGTGWGLGTGTGAGFGAGTGAGFGAGASFGAGTGTGWGL